jgi:hypothetical protein
VHPSSLRKFVARTLGLIYWIMVMRKIGSRAHFWQFWVLITIQAHVAFAIALVVILATLG